MLVVPSFSQSTPRRTRWYGPPLASNELTKQRCLKQMDLGTSRVGIFLTYHGQTDAHLAHDVAKLVELHFGGLK